MIINTGINWNFGDFFCVLAVNAIVPNINTVVIPAPTAASVNATSTASITIKRRADRKLKTPDSITTANNLSIRMMANAVTTSITNKIIFIVVSIIDCSQSLLRPT